MSLKPLQIIDPQGTPVGDVHLDSSEVRLRYVAMVDARMFDRKAAALQRQGRLATYPPYEGQEASQVGSALALRDSDWLVPSYRDAAAAQLRGYPWRNLLLTRRGDERGGHPPEGVKVLPPALTVGGHMIHAVGIAWAEKLQDSGAVVLTLFGDGATSEGDFHEAMNFAGVYRTPTIFFCQNNGWAISMPVSGQTASETIAQKANAYGLPGVLVDGNDVLAVDLAVSQAIDRARAGEGPTLIEALTYRVLGHTTADDHRRYRPIEDESEWLARDPLERIRVYLEGLGAWSPEWQSEIEEDATARIEEEVAAAEAVEGFSAEDIFDATFAEPTPQLASQRSEAGRLSDG